MSEIAQRKKLVYIAGTGRSGSTLLGTILAEADGCLAVGEANLFWHFDESTQFCSCGEKYSSCILWGDILKKSFQVNDPLHIKITGKSLKPNYHALLLLLGFDGFIRNEYVEILRKLFTGIYENSGVGALVDESKSLPYLVALQRTNLFDVYVVHVIRDPRAVAYSWQRKKSFQRNQDKKSIDPMYITRPYHVSARQWVVHQFVWWASRGFVEKEKYLSIRYEDFVADPQGHFNKICAKVNLHGDSPFISDDQFKIVRENHLVHGNPSAPKPGLNSIRKDAEWQEKMSGWAKMLVTLICWPMMWVYGYPIFSDHA